MKKTLLILVAMIFAVSACDKATYVDGTYSMTYDGFDTHDWNAFVEFTLIEDVISAVDFDYYDADMNRKSQDTAYQSLMFGIKGLGPVQFVPGIEALIANASILPQFDSIDAYTGATGARDDANALVEAALDLALAGEATEGTIPQTDVAE